MENKIIKKSFIILYAFVRKTNDHEDETLTVCTFLAFCYSISVTYCIISIYHLVGFELTKTIAIATGVVSYIIAHVFFYKYLFYQDRFEVFIKEYGNLSESKKSMFKIASIAIILFLVVVSVPIALYVWR